MFATAQPASLCTWIPSVTPACCVNLLDDLRDVERQHAAVRVAQDEALGAGLLGGGQHRHRERRIGSVPVEEMLGVEEHPPALRPQERDRVAHHRDALVQVGAQRLGDVQVPRLAHQTDDLGAGLEQVAQHLGVLGALARPRVMPNAVSVLVFRVSLVASLKNSVSRGFAPGHPPSTNGNPTWSSLCRMRSRSSIVYDRSACCAPSRSVVS